MKLCAVIAAYDEVENIVPLVLRLRRALDTIPDCSWELLFVVEGQDGTRELLQGLADELGSLKVLYQEEPTGLGAAFRRGFAAVDGDVDFVITLDADLNHQPEEIPRLLDVAQRETSDIVVGSRFITGSVVDGTPIWKRALSGSVNRLMRVLYGLKVSDKTSGFRIYRAEVLHKVSFENNEFAFLPELLIRANAAGFKITEAPIRFIFRRAGSSKMAFFSTSFSYLALLSARFRIVRK